MAKGNKIDLGYKDLDVDGVEYRLGTLSAMGVYQGVAWAMRCFGTSVASALAQSDGLGTFIAKVQDPDAVAKVMDLDASNPIGFFAQLNQFVEVSSIVSILGEAVSNAGDRLDDGEIKAWLKWAVIGKLLVPMTEGGRIEVESESDFDAYLVPHIRKHGPLHALRLFWAVMRAHTGPTSAGGPG